MKAALLVEEKDKDGNSIVMVYHIAMTQLRMEREYNRSFNIFEGITNNFPEPVSISVDGYLTDPSPRRWGGPMPTDQQPSIEPVNLAIASDEDILEGEIVDEDSRED